MFPNEAVANNAYEELSKIFAQMKGNPEPKGAPQLTSSDGKFLHDYVLQLQKKLVRQQRKKHASENGMELLWVKHLDSMCNERRACNDISSQNVDLEVADPNPLRTPCDKSVRESPGCEKDMDATSINPNRQATVCQTCGVTGYSELLVFCVDCQISAVHWYCLHEMPENNEVEVHWSCEECGQRFPKNIKEQQRSSEEHNEVEEVKPFRISRICTDRNSFNGNAIETKDSQDHAVLRPCPGRRNSFSERLSDVSAGQLEDQVATQIPYDRDAPLNSSCCQPLAEYNGYVHAQPILDPIWRGCFDVDNSKYIMIVGHLSNKACSKVREGAVMLPPVLCAKKLPRTDSWPKAFERSHPTDDSIGLYFFPESWRDKMVFDQLLCDMNGQDLALKIIADEADLLIFSSLLLPKESCRFCEKYYLWGIFKGRKVPPLHK
ncbi:uncharacterized protein LOC131251743 isoform X2 [Magnolia sinica]|uniref:uncharacterized protein LOC131251743 isoform X2 n=1 Tax=Magnolia sinica TaxID=86752 RepID=UPI002659556D|nr:uncharacterized protein LOC131251743 isoform X2 [Magnolia sinica]